MSYGSRAAAFGAGNKATNRPDWIEDEHLTYLDDLRESGDINMFGAGPYVQREYPDLSEDQASELLGYWMRTFGKEGR